MSTERSRRRTSRAAAASRSRAGFRSGASARARSTGADHSSAPRGLAVASARRARPRPRSASSARPAQGPGPVRRQGLDLERAAREHLLRLGGAHATEMSRSDRRRIRLEQRCDLDLRRGCRRAAPTSAPSAARGEAPNRKIVRADLRSSASALSGGADAGRPRDRRGQRRPIGRPPRARSASSSRIAPARSQRAAPGPAPPRGRLAGRRVPRRARSGGWRAARSAAPARSARCRSARDEASPAPPARARDSEPGDSGPAAARATAVAHGRAMDRYRLRRSERRSPRSATTSSGCTSWGAGGWICRSTRAPAAPRMAAVRSTRSIGTQSSCSRPGEEHRQSLERARGGLVSSSSSLAPISPPQKATNAASERGRRASASHASTLPARTRRTRGARVRRPRRRVGRASREPARWRARGPARWSPLGSMKRPGYQLRSGAAGATQTTPGRSISCASARIEPALYQRPCRRTSTCSARAVSSFTGNPRPDPSSQRRDQVRDDGQPGPGVADRDQRVHRPAVREEIPRGSEPAPAKLGEDRPRIALLLPEAHSGAVAAVLERQTEQKRGPDGREVEPGGDGEGQRDVEARVEIDHVVTSVAFDQLQVEHSAPAELLHEGGDRLLALGDHGNRLGIDRLPAAIRPDPVDDMLIRAVEPALERHPVHADEAALDVRLNQPDLVGQDPQGALELGGGLHAPGLEALQPRLRQELRAKRLDHRRERQLVRRPPRRRR